MPLSHLRSLAALVVAVACHSPVDPYAAVTSSIVLPTGRVVSGDSVVLLVTARNAGFTRLILGEGCGEGLDVEVTAPEGKARSLTRGLPQICPLFDSNVLEPGETDSVRVRWVVPAAPGTYHLRGGLRGAQGLGAPSPSRSLTIY